MVKLTLSDAILRPTTGYDAPVSISKDGHYVYIVYNSKQTLTPVTEAELFMTKDETLTSLRTFSGDLIYTSIDGGYASNDFNLFSILDDNQVNTARLRIIDKNFNLVSTTLFTDFYAPGFSFIGGKFSHDGKLVAVTYVNSNNTTQMSVLRVLKTDTLEIIASYNYAGNTLYPAKFFTTKCKCSSGYECKKNYIAVESTDGIFNFLNPAPLSSSILSVYKISFLDNSLTMVDSVNLPQLANFDIVNYDDKTMIIVGTKRSNTYNNVSKYINSVTSFLPNDSSELRIYEFIDKSKIKIVCKKNIDASIYVVGYPDCKHLLMAQENDNGTNNFFEIMSIDKDKCNCNCTLNSSNIGQYVSPLVRAAFSDNGKKLIVTGESMTGSLYNILLYKICK